MPRSPAVVGQHGARRPGGSAALLALPLSRPGAQAGLPVPRAFRSRRGRPGGPAALAPAVDAPGCACPGWGVGPGAAPLRAGHGLGGGVLPGLGGGWLPWPREKPLFLEPLGPDGYYLGRLAFSSLGGAAGAGASLALAPPVPGAAGHPAPFVPRASACLHPEGSAVRQGFRKALGAGIGLPPAGPGAEGEARGR